MSEDRIFSLLDDDDKAQLRAASRHRTPRERIKGLPDNVIEFVPLPYRTAQSTIDAFWYLVRLNDPDRLKTWLANHPLDAATLLKLYEGRQNVTA
jgi:hypothetical protein